MNALINPYLDTDQLQVPHRDADVELIVELTAQAYRLRAQDILGSCRMKRYAEARAVCCWMLRMRTLLSYPEMARVLDKDHSTCIVHTKNVIRRRTSDESFARFTDKLAAAIEDRLTPRDA